MHPDANTQAGEQTFVWMARYKNIVSSFILFTPYDKKEKQLYSEMLCQWQKACVATSEGLSIVTFMSHLYNLYKTRNQLLISVYLTIILYLFFFFLFFFFLFFFFCFFFCFFNNQIWGIQEVAL